jgi:hypothetical protein
MVGARAVGLVCNDPQRGQIALHAVSSPGGLHPALPPPGAGLAGLPADADAIGIASLVDGAALLSRLPAIPPGASLASAVGPIKGRCAVVQVRVRSELRPNGPDGTANLGPFRARSYAAAVVGGPQDADAASSSRERLLSGLPDFLARFVAGQSEAEALFLAILGRLHKAGVLEAPHANGTALAQATREVVDQSTDGSARHVVITNGTELVHVAAGMPSAILTMNGLSDAVANEIDPTITDSSLGRERLRRFRGVFCLGALETARKASAPVPAGASLQVLPESAAALVQRDLSVKLL